MFKLCANGAYHVDECNVNKSFTVLHNEPSKARQSFSNCQYSLPGGVLMFNDTVP